MSLLYRIIHIENLEFILESNELMSRNGENSDPNYVGIGDDSLINSRSQKQIRKEPFGTFNDYVAFYFGPRSPMLYAIYNGYNGVKKRNQSEIIYLVSNTDDIIDNGLQFCFFDGHGYHNFSECFNTIEDLDRVDWTAVNARVWNDTQDDPDRKRRKQAEFLVYSSVPLELINRIIVYDKGSLDQVNRLLTQFNIEIETTIDEDYYY